MKTRFEQFTWKVLVFLGLQPRMQPIPIRRDEIRQARERRDDRY